MTDGSGNSADVTESEARSASPYATGGGGVTLERRVAVTYLARLLTGATADELEGRRVERVSFQQAPAHDVDDLVVVGRRDDGTDLIELEIAVRRAPAFTTSDKDTEKLIGDLMAALRRPPDAGVMRELAICVAGPQKAAQQVGKLVETTISYTVCLTDPDPTQAGRGRHPRARRAGDIVNPLTCQTAAHAASDQLARLLSDAERGAHSSTTWPAATAARPSLYAAERGRRVLSRAAGDLPVAAAAVQHQHAHALAVFR